MNPVQRYFQETKENFRVFWFYFKKYRSYYLIGIGSLVIVDGLEALPPLLLKTAIDTVSENSHDIGGVIVRSTITKVVLAYMAIAVLQGFMRYLWRRYIVRTSMFASNDMRQELFAHLTTLAPGFFKRKRVGDLVSLATNDIEAIRFSLGPGALTLFDALFYFIAIPPIMIWLSPKLALISFLPLIFVPVFVRRMESRIQRHFREVQDKFSHLAAQCQEAMGGIRVIKGAALEPFKEKEFENLGNLYIDANLRAAVTQSSLSTVLEFFVSSSTTILFLLGGALVIREKISIGVFVAFQRYIQKMSWPMEAFGLAANIFQRSMASQKRVDEVMLEKAGILSPEKPRRPRVHEAELPEIEARNLNFRYPGKAKPALENISFRLRPGMKLGLAGSVGSGKSTLLACIARMEPVSRGQIFFGGEEVMDLSVESVRQRLAIVPQEVFLFSKSIVDNILYGCEGIPDAERLAYAEKAARAASVHDDILRLAKGYHTVLGERGVNLSGGQKQRISIARAFARRPQILLLDDCLSAVDAETEKKLLSSILRESQGLSLVVASHRLSSLEALDWVLVLEDGRVVEQGPPRELNKNETSSFHRLYEQSAAEESLEILK